MGAVMGHPVRNIFRQLLLGSLGAKSRQAASEHPVAAFSSLLPSAAELEAAPAQPSEALPYSHTSCCAVVLEKMRHKVSHVSVIPVTSRTAWQETAFHSLCLAKGCCFLLAGAIFHIFHLCHTLHCQHLPLQFEMGFKQAISQRRYTPNLLLPHRATSCAF